MRIVLCGGGTGGHVFPALAIGEALRAADHAVDLHYLGTAEGIESRLVPQAGEKLHHIAAGGIVGKSSLNRLSGLARAGLGVLQSLSALRSLKPDVVVGTGGFVMAPVLLAARLLGIPFLIQEQNSFPGLTTRKFARHARAVFLAYPDAKGYLSGARTMLTGNPLRNAIVEQASVSSKVSSSTPRTFVTGGSLGAKSINNAVAGSLAELCGVTRLAWQYGKTGLPATVDPAAVSELTAQQRLVCAPFFDDIHVHYADADIVVCRAGAMTLSELPLYGLPAILIPFPHAAHDHQRANAAALAKIGAVRVIEDAELTGASLFQAVAKLLADSDTRHAMSDAMRSIAKPRAAHDIAQYILTQH
ncbi:MAG: undecaprenyldiphospho-muramoylpentapeptide beta-N-acetylglucosaminyltransferase [bacterium]|nr:undecaprenyldiphospho-muramoylpentapeptide beta-N-acetylglucosaminyltransferase [bacterium]